LHKQCDSYAERYVPCVPHNACGDLLVLEGSDPSGSQADIVGETGLSRTTVTSLVAELLEEGIVVERADSARPAPSPSGGRPATLLSL
jgi:IclR helix-turn-helix domain